MFGLKELRLASAKATRLTEALAAHGINADAEDLSAAIAEKISAASAPELLAKAESWDKFATQAASLKLDPMAAISGDNALEAMIDSAARELLADHVKTNSPQITDHKEPLQSAPTGFAISAEWNKLCADASASPENKLLAAARDEFYAKHQDEILGNVNFTTPTSK